MTAETPADLGFRQSHDRETMVGNGGTGRRVNADPAPEHHLSDGTGRQRLMAKIIPCRDDPGNIPDADYRQRVVLACSILNHRFDTADPDVVAVLRALDGWSVSDLAEPPR